MTEEWTDRIVGDRMTVDQQFNDRVAQSQFSNQQWGLIMTAIEFDIEHADDPEQARLVADTSDLSTVIPELEKVEQGPAAMGGNRSHDSGGGLVDGIKDALGLSGGGDGNQEQLDAAEQLVQEYAERLQSHLEQQGKWADVRATFQADQ